MMQRVTSIEILDQGLASRAELEGNLNDLWRINRYLGGVACSRHLLSRFLARNPRRNLRVLEVGAGDGRLAGLLRRDLRRQGITAEFVILDRRLDHLRAGSPVAGGLNPVVADTLELPFAEESFDVATCNLLFHHFSGGQALSMLRKLAEVVRSGVLINDLERHWLAYLFVRYAPWVWRERVSRLDGIASVRQAYTGPELEDIVREAGFVDFEVHRVAPYRLGLVLWKSEAVPGNGKNEILGRYDMSPYRSIILAVALALAASGLFGQDASPGAAAGTPINVTAKKYEFTPAVIKVKQGDHVKLVVTATDRDHGIKLAAFNVNQRLEKGVATTVEFTADRAGTFPFECSVVCGLGHHRMKGQVIVEPSSTSATPAP